MILITFPSLLLSPCFSTLVLHIDDLLCESMPLFIFAWHYLAAAKIRFLIAFLANLPELFIKTVPVHESVMRTAEQYFRNSLTFLLTHVLSPASCHIFVCIFLHDRPYS